MNNENYIIVQGWQVNNLHLRGNELLLYALIYGFSQDGESEFHGSLAYMSSAIGVSKRNIIELLKRLEVKGLISKREQVVNNVKSCHYVANITSGDFSSPDNIYNNKYIYNNNILSRERNKSVREEGESANITGGDDSSLPSRQASKQGQCPFNSAEFRELWQRLLAQPKWRNKSLYAVQLSAKKLANFPEAFARELVLEAIERNYTGVVFDSTAERFEKWKRGHQQVQAVDGRAVLQAFNPVTATDSDFEQFNKAFNAMDNKSESEVALYWRKYGDYMTNLNNIK